MSSKIKSMVGFAIKAGKVVFGEDNIKKDKKVKLVVCCSSLDEKKLSTFLIRNVEAIRLDFTLAEITSKNAKMIGITDAQMASTIKRLSNEKN